MTSAYEFGHRSVLPVTHDCGTAVQNTVSFSMVSIMQYITSEKSKNVVINNSIFHNDWMVCKSGKNIASASEFSMQNNLHLTSSNFQSFGLNSAKPD